MSSIPQEVSSIPQEVSSKPQEVGLQYCMRKILLLLRRATTEHAGESGVELLVQRWKLMVIKQQLQATYLSRLEYVNGQCMRDPLIIPSGIM